MTSTPAGRAGVAPGAAAALVDALLDDVVGSDVRTSVLAHRARRLGPAGGALASCVAPVSGLGGVLDALDADPGSEPLPLVLLADTGLVEAAEARAILLDDDRVALTGLHVALPADGPPDEACRAVLDTLDFALPGWIAVPLVPGWQAALDVIAEDGAERALLATGPRAVGPDQVAAFVVGCVRRGVPFSLSGGAFDGVGAAAALAATAAALDLREETHVAALLAEPDADVLLSVLADADPLVLRRRLVSLGTIAADPALESLLALGLLDPEL